MAVESPIPPGLSDPGPLGTLDAVVDESPLLLGRFGHFAISKM
jgi:hypothetical protein